MKSPLQKYKEIQNITNIKKLAYDTLFTKYIVRNLKGDDKKWEIDSTDQESLMRKTNGGYPVPGFVYTFIYPPGKDEPVKVFKDGKEKEYVDYVPIVFCTSTENIEIMRGVNLNTLPNIERVKFFETYWKLYKNFFKDIEVKTQNDKLVVNEKFASLMSSPSAVNIVEIMSKIINANFKYGYRSYNIKRISQLRMIEYTEWDYIPFYDPKNAFRKMNQKQIHDLYWRTRENI